MRIAFVGDLHGRVFHCLAAVLACIRERGPLDVVVQVGDLGAFPDPTKLDEATKRFARDDPTELDFARLTDASSEPADALGKARAALPSPILFIRGNHEDVAYLDRCLGGSDGRTAAVDPFDLFHVVADGTVLQIGGARVGFCGGADYIPGEDVSLHGIRDEACQQLRSSAPVEVLVTHDGPYGCGVGRHGNTQGSKKVTSLLEALRPRHHLYGHYHHVNRPDPVSLGLAGILLPPRLDPTRRVQAGSVALLDTERGEIEVVDEPWLTDIGGEGFDFERWLR